MGKRTKGWAAALLLLCMAFLSAAYGGAVREESDSVAETVAQMMGEHHFDLSKTDFEYTEMKSISWDLANKGIAGNRPFNTTVHMDRITGMTGQIWANGRLEERPMGTKDEYISYLREKWGEEYYKANGDYRIAMHAYLLQHGQYEEWEEGATASLGLADYQWMRDNGWIMGEETSYYYGIKMQEDLTVGNGKTKKIRTSGTPKAYEKNIQTKEEYNGGGRVGLYCQFAKPVWESSNGKIASVSQNGTVKGLKKGKTTITATYRVWMLEDPIRLKDGKPYKWKDKSGRWRGFTITDTDGSILDGTNMHARHYDIVRKCKVTVK